MEFDNKGNIKRQVLNRVILHNDLLTCEIKEAKKENGVKEKCRKN